MRVVFPVPKCFKQKPSKSINDYEVWRVDRPLMNVKGRNLSTETTTKTTGSVATTVGIVIQRGTRFLSWCCIR